MSSERYTEEFKVEAVRQVVECGYSVAELTSRLGMKNHSLYAWKMKYGPDSAEYQERTAIENSGELVNLYFMVKNQIGLDARISKYRPLASCGRSSRYTLILNSPHVRRCIEAHQFSSWLMSRPHIVSQKQF